MTSNKTDVIERLIELVQTGFVWSDTKQGGTYWEQVISALTRLKESEVKMTERDLDLTSYEGAPGCAKLLMTAFTWSSSPNGHEYWSEVHTNLKHVKQDPEYSEDSESSVTLHSGRKACKQCVIKHLSAAIILMDEVADGYPTHKYYVIGNLSEAESECGSDNKDLKESIRDARKTYYGGDSIDLLPLLEKAEHMRSGCGHCGKD